MKPKRGPRRRNNFLRDVTIKSSIVNDNIVHKNVRARTKDDYDRQLENWDDFVERWGPDKSATRLKDLKEFMFRLGVSMRENKNLKPDETMAQKGVGGYWKHFTAAYQKHRGPLAADHILSVTHLLQPGGELYVDLNLVPDSGPRKHATELVFIMIGKFLWTLDWKVFARPCFRVDLWAVISAKIFTSSRMSDYIESSSRSGTGTGLYYKDITLIVFRNEHGRSEFAIQLTKFLKGHSSKSSKLPQCDLHEGDFWGPQPLFMNPIMFLLVIFCAKGALREYHGMEGLSKLLDLEVSEHPGFKCIQWDRTVLDLPVFSSASGSILKAATVSGALRELGIRSGCPEPPTLHDFRAEGLTKMDMNPNYTETQRQRVAGHENNKMHQQHYAARNAGVDTQATYLGKQPREINTGKLFRHLEVPWEPALWQTLPLAEREELERSKEYKDRRQELVSLKSGSSDMDTKEEGSSLDESKDVHPRPNAKPRRSLKSLEIKKLREYWKRNKTEAVAGSEEYVCRGVNLPFSRLRPILPIRRRLAELLGTPASLRSETGRETLECLVRLYESRSEVHRPGLEMCLCARPRSQLHVYQCTKRRQLFAEFCFFCNEWLYEPEAWEKHCRSHITQGHVPLEMAWEKIEGTFLPGYCPFCVGDGRRPAAERLVQFCDKKSWESHIWEHRIDWRIRCPDSRCDKEFESQEPFVYHMYDLHRIPRELFWNRGLKRKASTDLDGIPGQKFKVEKLFDNGAVYFESCTVQDMKKEAEKTYRMLAYTFLLLLPFAIGHSWVEQLRRLGLNGTMIGDVGYMRGAIPRLDPAFNDLKQQHLLPPPGRNASLGILPSDPICRDTQQTPGQFHPNRPPLKAWPGDIIALQHQENGHVTLPENTPHKPRKSVLWIYGTSLPSDNDRLLSIHHVWDASGKGGDGRGVLLATRQFDDGRCYQINDGPISVERQKAYPKVPTDPQGADLWCQSDLRLPMNIRDHYTIYWVWEWPTIATDKVPWGAHGNLYEFISNRSLWPGLEQAP
ncbi:hypothetical protein PG987_004233 [Apiospora arundinis]